MFQGPPETPDSPGFAERRESSESELKQSSKESSNVFLRPTSLFEMRLQESPRAEPEALPVASLSGVRRIAWGKGALGPEGEDSARTPQGVRG